MIEQEQLSAPIDGQPLPNSDVSPIVKEASSTLLTAEAKPESEGAKDANTISEGPKGEEQTSKEDAKPVGPPEKYDFKAEGVELDPKAIEAFEPVARELGLSQEQAQKLVDIEVSRTKARAEEWVNLQEKWKNDSLSDKEIGGARFNENLLAAQSALKAIGTPELTQLLNDSGAGNHPEMIRMLIRVNKLIAEDKMFSASATAVAKPRTLADAMFPNYGK